MLNGKPAGVTVRNRVDHAISTEARSVPGSEYKHILIPTRFSMSERAALRMGLQMAQANHANVTVLHVVRPEMERSMHWLDAIDQLHRSMSSSASTSRHVGAAGIEAARNEIQQFLERAVPAQLRETAVRADCRAGDVAEEVARYADENGVDLIVLCSDRSPWTLPFWPSLSHRLMGLTDKQVVSVRPDTSPVAPLPNPKASKSPGA